MENQRHRERSMQITSGIGISGIIDISKLFDLMHHYVRDILFSIHKSFSSNHTYIHWIHLQNPRDCLMIRVQYIKPPVRLSSQSYLSLRNQVIHCRFEE